MAKKSSVTKRISNPVTGTYYRLRIRTTPAGRRGTIMGKWRPTATSSHKK